jgi:hypothetical protein
METMFRARVWLLAGAAALAGCGGPRQIAGDPGGVPVAFEVTLSRQFVRDLKNRGPGGREDVVVYQHYGAEWYGTPYYYGRDRRGRLYPIYDPFWSTGVYVAGPAPTRVHLLAGDGPGQARTFRVELDYGTNSFDVPITPGRKVTLTVQAYGGLDGWEEVGSFTADNRPGQRVVLDLREHAPRITVSDPPPPPPPQQPPPPPAPVQPPLAPPEAK